jgi:hypothetical protein
LLTPIRTTRTNTRLIPRALAVIGSFAAVVALSAALDLGPESAANASEGVKLDPMALTLRGPVDTSVTGDDQFDGQSGPEGDDPISGTGHTVGTTVPVMIESREKNDDGAFEHVFYTSGAVVRQAYQSAYQQDVTVTYQLEWLTKDGWAAVPDAAAVQRTATMSQGEAAALGEASWTLPLKYTDLPDTSYRVTFTATWYGTTGDAKGFELATRTINPKDVGPAVHCQNDELTCSENQADGYVTV